MAKNFLFYNPLTIAAQNAENPLPGIEKFTKFLTLYNNSNIALVDRTGTIRLPVRTKNIFPIPAMRPMKRTLQELCDDRACELLTHAEAKGVPINVMWSGGIDSTLVLVSLLKNATEEQKEHIVVLLTQDSIGENPNFYVEHISGKLHARSSNTLPYIIGKEEMIVGGEGNDQIFGASAVYRRVLERQGISVLHEPYNRDFFSKLYLQFLNDPALISFYLDLLEKLRDAASVPIITNADFAWWDKFVMKWQCVNTRKMILVSPRNRELVTKEWMSSMYRQFFMTDEFQLWSMNNMDKRLKDTWTSYKWPCKDIIYDFTKDAEYRDKKTKWGSLSKVFVQRHTYSFLDEDARLYDTLPPEEYYEPRNDFI